MKIDRRKFFKTVGTGTAALGLGSVPFVSQASSLSSQQKEDDEQVLFIGDNIAIADTVYGKVKGYILRDVYTFLGMPYGADTSGKNRFMPPAEPEPWEGIKPAVYYGNSAPQIMDNRFPNNYSTFADHWNYDDVSENCLTINVWTPGINDAGKRPVLVWLHGGGYTNGNGIEQDGYHGGNISKYGNIVFCSINHRLGPIGFSDLSAVGGEKYKDSGNVGMLDIIASLKWINKNIANFGGDPGNVTIIGQSGGGAKVCTVLAMPEAQGLVHKGVALSGSTTKALSQDYSRKLGEYILQEAGVTRAEIDELQNIPWREYLSIANAAMTRLNKETGVSGMMRGGFAPVADGFHLPSDTFYSDPTSFSSSIPLMICTTFHEWSPSRTDPEIEKMTMDGLLERIKAMKGDKAPVIVDAYAKAFPKAKPIELFALIISSRQGAVATAEAKLKQNAPVYMAWFGWEPPLFDNRMRAFHCLDICFWFKNTDLMLTHTGGGARPRKLSVKMADALLNFMKKGDPNGGALPQWPRFTSEKGEVMVLNDVCEVKNDPDRKARATLV